MIAALAITLYLECGMPDRLLVSDWPEWQEYRVTPYYERGKWTGYQIIAPNWARNQIQGREIKRIDQCDKQKTQRG